MNSPDSVGADGSAAAAGLRTRDRLAVWLLLVTAALAVTAAVVLLGGRPARGQELAGEQPPLGPTLYQRDCASCHGNRGQGSFRGPSLVGVGAASADYWIRSGRMPLPLLEPGQEARRGEVVYDEPQIRELVDYVERLGDGPAIPQLDLDDVDLAAGGELYRINCAPCHNWDGKGGALVNRGNAPPLHPVPALQVAEAVRVGPGAMPLFSERQLDDQGLDDVVAYVDYLRTPDDEGGYGLAHWGPATETVAALVGLAGLVAVTAWLGERRRD